MTELQSESFYQDNMQRNANIENLDRLRKVDYDPVDEMKTKEELDEMKVYAHFSSSPGIY